MYFLLTYELTANYLTKREEFRDAHLNLAMSYVNNGSLCLGGALQPSASQALLVFKCKNARIVEELANQDPYVLSGIVSQWHIHEWHIVLGTGVDPISLP
jgi:hypothetical protein